jgi:hypothetical protein
MNNRIITSNGLEVLQTQMISLMISLKPYEFILLLISLFKRKP